MTDASKFRLRTDIGADIGNFSGDLIWNHNSGYKLGSAQGFVPQAEIGSFNTFDLFASYDFKGESVLKDLSLTLSVNNLFDTDPPLSRRIVQTTPSNSGYTNGATLGRLIQLGFSKKF